MAQDSADSSDNLPVAVSKETFSFTVIKSRILLFIPVFHIISKCSRYKIWIIFVQFVWIVNKFLQISPISNLFYYDHELSPYLTILHNNTKKTEAQIKQLANHLIMKSNRLHHINHYSLHAASILYPCADCRSDNGFYRPILPYKAQYQLDYTRY
ncbi:hypothetical protein SDC9_164409 [bioreactor metagenome]|uniref:Uncharacterized protein n=1 Tax=bioreactor metagenome TaxID=1076179 RepID=A0A645FT17_9ZZZZ